MKADQRTKNAETIVRVPFGIILLVSALLLISAYLICRLSLDSHSQ